MKASDSQTIAIRTCHIIRDERIARDLTQMEMASLIGISQSALSKIENHSMLPTLIPWLRFCEKFDIPSNLPCDEKRYRGWARSLEKKEERVPRKIGKPQRLSGERTQMN